ncbi:hypothetical protein L1787_03890 [Acuticoccus sp. M5D2P5]|uniref:hypothetical protein n=1 Tax=Acuticoccus kalidii TaxID=2910977 RepID=UPI001F1AAE6B|nr:hypothetical protein [Acuticoccus kalidii]MCF3932556.1 hypothetical protein [Acuticoccus kalidii]
MTDFSRFTGLTEAQKALLSLEDACDRAVIEGFAGADEDTLARISAVLHFFEGVLEGVYDRPAVPKYVYAYVPADTGFAFIENRGGAER